jgi:hypothetical protein
VKVFALYKSQESDQNIDTMLKKSFFILISLCFSICISAQNVAADFALMHNAYLNNYLSLDFSVRQYQNAADQKGEFIGNGIVRKSKADYYSLFDKQEMIVASNKMVTVDHTSRSINYYSNLPNEKPVKANAMMIDTSLLEQADSVKFLGQSEAGKKYMIYTSAAEAIRTEIIIDPVTFLIREISYFYPPASSGTDYGAYKITIRYTRLSLEKPENNYFNLNKYVAQGKTPSATTAYKNYRFTIIN